MHPLYHSIRWPCAPVYPPFGTRTQDNQIKPAGTHQWQKAVMQSWTTNWTFSNPWTHQEILSRKSQVENMTKLNHTKPTENDDLLSPLAPATPLPRTGCWRGQVRTFYLALHFGQIHNYNYTYSLDALVTRLSTYSTCVYSIWSEKPVGGVVQCSCHLFFLIKSTGIQKMNSCCH